MPSNSMFRAHEELEKKIMECQAIMARVECCQAKRRVDMLTSAEGRRIVETYYRQEKEALTLLLEKSNVLLKDSETSECFFLAWIRKNTFATKTRTKYYVCLLMDFAQTMKTENPPNSDTFTIEEFPKTVPIAGSIEKDNEDSVGIDEELADFLNRSSQSIRYKLDGSLETSMADLSMTKELIVESLTNEKFVTPPTPKTLVTPSNPTNHETKETTPEVVPSVEIIATDPFPIDLNQSEELLEDVKKPEENLVNFQMSPLLKKYQKKRVEEDKVWTSFIDSESNYRKDMIEECVNSVWDEFIKTGSISEIQDLKNKDLIENHKPKLRFDDIERNEMYISEWYQILLDVIYIAIEVLPKLGNSKQPNHANHDNFLRTCKKKLSKSLLFAPVCTKGHNWDTDLSRRIAHDMVASEVSEMQKTHHPWKSLSS